MDSREEEHLSKKAGGPWLDRRAFLRVCFHIWLFYLCLVISEELLHPGLSGLLVCRSKADEVEITTAATRCSKKEGPAAEAAVIVPPPFPSLPLVTRNIISQSRRPPSPILLEVFLFFDKAKAASFFFFKEWMRGLLMGSGCPLLSRLRN